jgi:hypothetical protein
MKHTLLLTALAATLFANPASAQLTKVTKVLPEANLGLKLGANMQQTDGGNINNDYKAGIFGGIFVGVHKNKIGVQMEALLKQVTYELNAPTATGNKVKVLYVDVPVLFQYKIVNRVWLQVGPQFSAMLSAKDNNSKEVKNYFKSSDIAAVGGVDVRLPFRLSAGARYVMGLTDVNNNTVPGFSDAWKNRSIQVYLGYRFL